MASWRERYDEHLASEKWQRTRAKVIEREHGRCQGCGNRGDDMHHTTYANLGHEFLFELQLLCRRCHDRWHKKKPRDGMRGWNAEEPDTRDAATKEADRQATIKGAQACLDVLG